MENEKEFDPKTMTLATVEDISRIFSQLWEPMPVKVYFVCIVGIGIERLDNTQENNMTETKYRCVWHDDDGNLLKGNFATEAIAFQEREYHRTLGRIAYVEDAENNRIEIVEE